MPTFYNYTEGGQVYAIDDVFVPADAFRQGGLWVWGTNGYGQLGVNDTNKRCTPVTTSAGGANWKQVAFGPNRQGVAAIKTDGTLWVWGKNEFLQLGINNTNMRCTPVTTFAGGTNWKQVSSGDYQTAAIKTDGTLWNWGINFKGTTGSNDATYKSTPVTTFAGGTNWKQVVCGGAQYTLAIKTDGTLWGWGNNQYGQLGNNGAGNADPLTPITTFAGGTNWKQVACGTEHTAAIKTDGTLWTWGAGYYGQLGVNAASVLVADTQKFTPVTTFAGGTNWKQVACGRSYTAAIKTDGTLWVWGYNNNGQLGINNTDMRCTPVTTFAGGTNWKLVSCGTEHTAAIKTDGTLWTWGQNYYGQLGINNTTYPICTPVTTFAGGTNWKQVACNYDHTTALTYIDDYQ